MKTIEELDNEIKELRCVIAVLQIKIDGILKHEPENCECADVDKAFEEWVKITPDEKTSDWPRLTKAFALYFAQRCGVVFTESINHIHLKDGVDVYKALSDFVMDKNRTLPMHDADWLEFAQYFAKRCGVVLDGNSEIPNNHKCDHPYHSVVGGNGSPERCLTCGKILSD